MSAFWSKFTRRLRATRAAMRGADRMLLPQMIVFASSVPLLMRLSPGNLERLLELRGRRDREASPEDVEKIVRQLQLARRIASPLVGSGCLTRGLTLYYFLRRAGLDVTLCFGIGRVAGEFTGHCWLSRGGTPFLEERDPRVLYAHVFSLPFDASRSAPTSRLRDLPCL